MEIRPITYKNAVSFVRLYHRHHDPPAGCKWCLGLYQKDELIGVSICGRPVNRILDDGLTCEITRLCTLGAKNACSMLYGASARVAKEMGYKKIITYTLETESGSSLKASGFVCEGRCGAKKWRGKRSGHSDLRTPQVMKNRWIRIL